MAIRLSTHSTSLIVSGLLRFPSGRLHSTGVARALRGDQGTQSCVGRISLAASLIKVGSDMEVMVR